MDASDAPEVVPDHTRDPEPCVPMYNSQIRQPQQPQQLPEQQQYPQTLPLSQAAYPKTSQQSPNGDAVGQSTRSDSGVDGKGRSPKRSASVCGISRALFITLVVLTVVVIAAAVGGGVGGSMAVKSAYNDGAKGTSNEQPAADMPLSSTNAVVTATPAASTTETSLYTAPTAGVQLALDCPRLTGEKVTIKYGSDYEASFNLACGLNERNRGSNLFSGTVYTYNDCMRLCVSYNRASHTRDCQGASFGADLSDNVVKVYANCFLKNSTMEMSPTTNRFLFATLNS
ncbi:hypothetical protein PG993_013343 [Apiospora rasikravindrae]|uniref:Apple domain-containing protein n=1 Tax=Apiospora rasikravindrae TaxID=990691 RepID=A0ABR1RXD8_9PEZI